MKKLSLYVILVLMWCNTVYAFNFEEDYVCLSVKGEVIDLDFVPEDNYKNFNILSDDFAYASQWKGREQPDRKVKHLYITNF